ncbi:acyl-CoA dehydrogenase (plasmid) [Phaeobacter inhibens]|uniref:acyl-CoA dehydrogenase n=1 Tax=Phaeobacter inhibens TaxID=221822 RepID=UPI0002EA997A|nr:acyl-CoA dehydrogenase [Phaeobacter inhibens]AUQ48167.1 putative acyl-Co-A dehydrogenase [Phaeobacter inhibens]AXT24956.1 acyl-CoA dehydrogenase [Phaeobacter inhibens]
MAYQAPIRDIMFNLEHLSAWPQVTSLPTYDGIEASDAEAALEGFGRFCTEIIEPLSAVGDTVGARFDGVKVAMPASFEQAYTQFVDMGWQSLSHPAEHGGMGLPRAVGAAATEILNAADMSFGLCPLLTDGAIDALLLSGSEEQKARYLEPMITGQWSGTMNLTEPQAGSDLGRVRCKAERCDDGSFAITGTKIFITYGEHDLSENIIHLVLARTPDAPAGPKGLSLFIVPKYMVQNDGSLGARNAVNCVSIEHKMGVRASPTAVLEFDAAKGFLVGEENRGLEYMFVMMTSARFSVGVQGVAVSERALQHALAFAQERQQGRPVDGSTKDAVSINQHPDVRRMLLRMRGMVEGGRALALATAGWLDLAHSGDEQANAMAEFLVPLVKGNCSERSVEVTSLGLQIHGGMGFIEETGVAQLCRDARILPIYEGTTAIQANDLLGRKVLRDGGETARRFSALIAETEDQLNSDCPQSRMIAERLSQARTAFDASLSWLLETAPTDPNAAFAGGVPFLMLTGNLAVGWQFGRAALVARAQLERGEDAAFMSEKIATACFYAQHILVECAAERVRIIEGSDCLFAPTLQT